MLKRIHVVALMLALFIVFVAVASAQHNNLKQIGIAVHNVQVRSAVNMQLFADGSVRGHASVHLPRERKPTQLFRTSGWSAVCDSSGGLDIIIGGQTQSSDDMSMTLNFEEINASQADSFFDVWVEITIVSDGTTQTIGYQASGRASSLAGVCS